MDTKQEITGAMFSQFVEQFERERQERLVQGRQEYGDNAFLKVDLFKYAKEEVLDLANYALFIYIKLALLEQEIADGVHVDRTEQSTGSAASDEESLQHGPPGTF